MTDDLAVPTSICMDLDDAISTSVQASRHKFIEFGEVGCVEIAVGDAIGKICPSYCQTECVEAIGDEMCHLSRAVLTTVFEKWWLNDRDCLSSIDGSSPFKPIDV